MNRIVLELSTFIVYSLALVSMKKPLTGMESLVRKEGIVYSDLDPDGEVRVDGIIWRARHLESEKGPVKKGEFVIVEKVGNLTLLVRRKP